MDRPQRRDREKKIKSPCFPLFQGESFENERELFLLYGEIGLFRVAVPLFERGDRRKYINEFVRRRFMRIGLQITIGFAAVIFVTSLAEAQKPIVYPAKGQSSAQQSKDDSECYSWAKQNT